jgi:hypothetical protein
MMRLNPAPRLNLYAGQRVQSDINGSPETVYTVHRLYEHPEASGKFAAIVVDEFGNPIGASATAACWFWPEGVLAAVPESPERIKRLESELSETKIALVEARRKTFDLEGRLQRIRAAAWL